MSPAKILSDLTAAGIRLEARDGTLTAGPREALTDELRALIREHKAALLVELDQSIPRRSWLIRHADGAVASHTFSPDATLAQVREWYPGAEIALEAAESPVQPATGNAPAQSPPLSDETRLRLARIAPTPAYLPTSFAAGTPTTRTRFPA